MAFVLALLVASVPATNPLSVTADCEMDPKTGLLTALKAVRARSAGTPAVLSVQGMCQITKALQLGPADSNLDIVGVGTKKTPSPGITGGVAITGWAVSGPAKCTGCGSIYVADLPAGATNARQFYIDGRRANRTVMLFPQATAHRTLTGFRTPLTTKFTHNDGAGIEMLHRGTSSCNMSSTQQWQETRLPVATLTTSSTSAATLFAGGGGSSDDGEFVMVQPAFNHSNATTNLPCYIENVFELLGDETHGNIGDYYLDPKANKVYVVSPKTPINAVLPQSVGLMVLTNTTKVTVSSLELKEATWLLDNNGFVQWQAGCIVKGVAGFKSTYGSVVCMPGSVDVRRGREVGFTNCSFTHLGAAGISFTEGSQNNKVSFSLFEDISGTAVSIGEVSTSNETDLDNHVANNVVTDNTVRHVANEFLGTCGITAFYSSGSSITHNEVYHVPYTGISMGWGWTWTQEALWPKMPWDHANTISNNHIHEVDGMLGDGGSLYTLGNQGNRPFRQGTVRKSYPAEPVLPLKILPMSQMSENWVEHNGWPERPRNGSIPGDGTHGPGGVYTDNGSTGWNVSSNVFKEVTVWAIACYTSGIDNNSYINNTMLCGSWCGPIQKQHDCPMANNTYHPNMNQLSRADLAVIANAGPRSKSRLLEI